MNKQEAIYQYILRFADTAMIMGQRLAEWCSKGPILEEDLALTNIALDYFGQAEAFYTHAIKDNTDSVTPDDLAFKRNEREYYNFLMAEVENGDFAKTMIKVYLMSSYLELVFNRWANCSNDPLSVLGQKAIKEVTYHKRHSSSWIYRLSHGTKESATRVQDSLNDLWQYTDDLFLQNDCDLLIKSEFGLDLKIIKEDWQNQVVNFFNDCELFIPQNVYMIVGGINQMHTEALGHMLCEMQFLQRAYPGANW